MPSKIWDSCLSFLGGTVQGWVILWWRRTDVPFPRLLLISAVITQDMYGYPSSLTLRGFKHTFLDEIEKGYNDGYTEWTGLQKDIMYTSLISWFFLSTYWQRSMGRFPATSLSFLGTSAPCYARANKTSPPFLPTLAPLRFPSTDFSSKITRDPMMMKPQVKLSIT